jgi:hypothetical protein
MICMQAIIDALYHACKQIETIINVLYLLYYLLRTDGRPQASPRREDGRPTVTYKASLSELKTNVTIELRFN